MKMRQLKKVEMIDAWTQTTPRAEPTEEEKKKAERLKQAQAVIANLPKDHKGNPINPMNNSRLARGSVNGEQPKLERFEDLKKPRNSTLPGEVGTLSGAESTYIQ
jgi:hypothetical protein